MKKNDGEEKNKVQFSKPYFLFIAGAFCYWVSLPPFGFWFLVFLVPVFWTFVIEHPKQIRLRTIYFGAFFFWLVSIWWIACPHPLTILGLFALAAYLSIYWLLFFAVSRIAVYRFGIPAVWVFPACWIGCEYLRNHILGGFSFCSLEHALYRQPLLIQIADIGGGYLVGGMIMLTGSAVGSGVGSLMTRKISVRHCTGYIFAGIIFVATLSYGFIQTAGLRTDKSNLTVAVLQGNIPVRLNGDSEQAEKTLKQFIDLAYEVVQKARAENQPLDLIILPETVCPIPLLKYNNDLKPSEFEYWTEEAVDYWNDQFGQLQKFVKQLGVPVLVGLSTLVFEELPEPKRLNSALLIDPQNDRTEFRYDKIQLVMFGEYIPFSQYLPKNFFLKTLCQEAGRGAEPVAVPLAIPLDGGCIFLSVNICFESTVPHFIRKQILTLKRRGKEPAVLINISNDGWFWFSQQIDQHLATHIFRAVENRRSYITATNGGFSAIIDSRGVIRSIGRRREAESVTGLISAMDYATPVYHYIGDFPAIFCTAILFLLILLGRYKN
ncbi:MAG: apolipoprotein N-acyltransferase [Planctomycetaceae bacterium]|jgi:apolipoprotein N-acyltransferase|nr:apolipoprotein N-acyltransferase [Planctomycetaceae bacterium]